MSPNRSRFVTACQQLLALGVVLAALTPAASVITLDVVGTGPTGRQPASPETAALAAYTAEAVRPSRVPTTPVKPHVREVQLTASTTTSGRAVPTTSARVVPAHGSSTLTTTPSASTCWHAVTKRLRFGDTRSSRTCGGRSHTSSKFHTSHRSRVDFLSNYKPVISSRHADEDEIAAAD